MHNIHGYYYEYIEYPINDRTIRYLSIPYCQIATKNDQAWIRNNFQKKVFFSVVIVLRMEWGLKW